MRCENLLPLLFVLVASNARQCAGAEVRENEVPAQIIKSEESSHATNKPSTETTTDRMQPSTDAKLSIISGGRYMLDGGSVLVHKRKPVQLQTPHGEVSIQSHAAALVSVDSEVTRVIDLFDWRIGCIKVSAGKSTKSLGPGSEMALVIAQSPEEAQHLVLSDGLRRRKVKTVDMGQRHFAVASELSLVDAILKQPLLNQLRKSPNKDDKAVYEEIIKTAAALSASGATEPYTVHE